MSHELRVSVGQYSDRGRKEANQDFHGICIPGEPALSSKGIAVALADGISSSDVGQIASQSAVSSFLEDYYCTSDAWSVKTSAERVLNAANSWLHSQTQQNHRYDKDRGYVCTLSAMVIRSATAHVFHVGDTRIYRLCDNTLEQLTTDHRVWHAKDQSYLSRALGINAQLEIDYQALPVEEGDVFLLATDGVYEYAGAAFMVRAVRDHADELDRAARSIAEEAYAQGSGDNLTVQIVRIDALPSRERGEVYQQLSQLPLPPILEARAVIDGYRIIREVHGSNRSHIYLALDGDTSEVVILKTPSVDLVGDPAHLERFLMEEWIARRINSAHVLKPSPRTRTRSYQYLVMEFIEGRTLAQWMRDNPKPDLETVRGIVEQIARGLLAFHRLEMLHQDLRPENIMIDARGTVKIIDFGSTSVAGNVEGARAAGPADILGTPPYTAPEYFLGEGGTSRSDIFSLGVITYQMLSGKLPYGAQVAKCRTREAQKRLRYESVVNDSREIPAWVDGALRKAVHPNPARRYAELSEYLFDLRHPNREFVNGRPAPLMERNPVAFWKSVSFVLALVVAFLLSALQKFY